MLLDPGVTAPNERPGPSLYFAFRDDLLLVASDPGAARVPELDQFAELGLDARSEHYMGALGERHCFAVDVGLDGDVEAPDGTDFLGLRELFGPLGEDLFVVAGRAFQIVNWDRTHRYCGRCGSNTVRSDVERARKCPDCGLLSFPRVTPAVITLVERGREFLLARNARFPRGRYSIIAGFVETGETLEQAVAREIREEVGIEVKNIRYFGSQPWPFPHSLMIGFTAQHASGEIRIDEDEIADAGWYTADNLPDLPDGISISRKIIDSFLDRHK